MILSFCGIYFVIYCLKQKERKKMKAMIKILTVLLIAGGFSASVYAGNPQDRQAKKEAKKAALEKEYQQTANLLENRNFVLEADYLANRFGSRVPVTSNLNFIKVDSSKAVIQIGSPTGLGYNGVGGVTAEGRIGKWQVTQNPKKKSFQIYMNLMTPLGAYDVHFFVGADGYAQATLSGITPGKLTYSGYLVPNETSRVYQGYNTY